MSRVCFVLPPSEFLEDDKVFPQLGPLYVAQEWADRKPDEVVVSDYTGGELSIYQGASLYAFSATTPQLPWVVREARNLVGSPKILGGSHVTVASTSPRLKDHMAKLRDLFDHVVVGDGVRYVRDYSGIDDYPLPARSMIHLAGYNYEIMGERATSVLGSFGCPFRCGFCSGRSASLYRVQKKRRLSVLSREIAGLYKTYGYKAFMLYDDELNLDEMRVDALCAELKSMQDMLGVEMKFRGFIRAAQFTKEMARRMRDAGFVELMVGFESAEERILKNMNKKTTLRDNSRCVEFLKEAGIRIKALMSLGHPGETEDSIMRTKEWLEMTKPESFDLTVITPYPGSPYYDDAVEVKPGVFAYSAKNGDRLFMRDIDFMEEVAYYKGDSGSATHMTWTEALSPERLHELRDEVAKDLRETLYDG